MPPKKKQKVKRVAKIKQKVKVTQNVIVNVGKGVAKRKKSNVGKKESSKPTYVQIPLIVPSQPFQPSTVAFSSADTINSALKTDITREQNLIDQVREQGQLITEYEKDQTMLRQGNEELKERKSRLKEKLKESRGVVSLYDLTQKYTKEDLIDTAISANIGLTSEEKKTKYEIVSAINNKKPELIQQLKGVQGSKYDRPPKRSSARKPRKGETEETISFQ